MNCRKKEEFRLEELVSDIEKTELSEEEQILFKLFKRTDENTLVDNARDIYYDRVPKEYDAYAGELEARVFWEYIKDAAGDDEYLGKIKLTPDDKEALEDACKGIIGIGLYVRIMDWFFEHGFIRSDITIYNCRMFRFLDAYLMTEKSIVMGVFDHYEDIRDINKIHEEVMVYLGKNIPRRFLRILEKTINEYTLGETELNEQEKNLIELTSYCLRPFAESIYEIVFKA